MSNEVINTESELKEHTQRVLDLLCPPVTYTSLRRLFLLLVQSHFAFPENHGPLFQEMLKCRVYPLSGEVAEGVLDVSLTHTKRANKDQVPQILVGLAGGAFEKGGIGGDFASMSDDNATRFQTKIAQTQVVIKFKDEDPDLALTMAESTMGFIEALKMPLLKELGLHSLDIVQLSDINPEDAEPENADAVTLRVNIQFDFSVGLSTESHRLKKMSLTLRPGP